MKIAIDFDGTVVTHEFPLIGEDIGAEPVLKALVRNGHKLILNTMRSHKPYDYTGDGAFLKDDLLQNAVDWFKDRDIELYGINEDPDQKEWTDSPKVHANLYIDDAALGCPKKMDANGRVIVDWDTIDHWFKQLGIIKTI